MFFYSLVLHFHSLFRYIVLILLLVSITRNMSGVVRKAAFTKNDKKLALFTMTAFHVQFLIGLVLYFISPKVIFQRFALQQEVYRFFTVEHISMMCIAVILITIGYSKSKAQTGPKGHSLLLTFYGIAIIIVLLAIPWPFRTALGGGWY